MPPSPTNKSSPTALGILLRSSMFKDLLEKNSNDETEENAQKKLKSECSDDNNDQEFGGMFDYFGRGSCGYVNVDKWLNVADTNEEMMLRLLSMGTSVWNGSFYMSQTMDMKLI